MSDLEMIVRCTVILYGYAVVFGAILWTALKLFGGDWQ